MMYTHEPHGQHAQRSWSVLALLVAAQFMVILDITIVNVALPSIGRALSFSAADLQWVVTAYIVCSGGLLLVGGRAADLLGRRRTFLAGLLLFTGASLVCGLAPSAGVLVGARAVQGTGASLLTPSALAIITTTYTGPQRVRALSIWGAVASAGIGVGVIVGGVLTTWLSWHWVFLVNVPVGVVTAVLALRTLPRLAAPAQADRHGTGRRSLDVPGAVTSVGGVAVLVYALSGAPAHGWGSLRTDGLIALALALLAAFAALERRAAAPLVPPATWRIRSLTAGSAVMLGATGLLAGMFFLNSVYLQSVLQWSALRTGLAFLPFVAAIMLAVHGGSHLIPRTGARPLVALGMGLTAVGAGLMALAPAEASYGTDLLPGFVALGLGMGLAMPAISITAMSEAGHETAGLASGLMSTAHEIGAALGVAVLSAVAAGAAGGAPAGFGDACAVAAVIAMVLAAGAAAAMPSVRPAPGAHVAMH